MTFSGLNETGGTNTAVELYTVGSGWSAEEAAGWTPPLYPRMHLLPNGTVLYSGSGTGSRIFNPSTKTWSGVVATTNYAGTRTYGTSVLLPLTPANGYKPRVMIMGGGNPATPTTEIIDMSAATPKWTTGPSMSQPRIEMNATILPNGKVLAVGGSTNDEDVTTASLNADLYDPATNTFSSAGANVYPRVYHSGSLLLPDATVLLIGGNPARGSYEQHTEIYSPAYLFDANDTAALRPAINTVTPGTFSYGGTFQVQTGDAANIASVVLVRPGAPTHAFDMDQRLVGLSYTVGAGVLNVTAPPNGNIAPPGYYMLFVLNTAGVPSVASFVKLSAANQPPTATIISPGHERHRESRPGGVLLRERQRSGRNHLRVCLDVPRRESQLELGGHSRQRDLLDAGQFRRHIQGHGQRRPHEPARDAHDHRVGLLAVGDTGLANRAARRRHELHRDSRRRNRIQRHRQLQRERSAFRRERVVQSRICQRIRLHDAERIDERYDPAWHLYADDQRHQRTGHSQRECHARGHRRLLDRGHAGQQDDRRRRHRHVHGDHHSGIRILGDGESLRERRSNARHRRLLSRLHRRFRDRWHDYGLRGGHQAAETIVRGHRRRADRFTGYFTNPRRTTAQTRPSQDPGAGWRIYSKEPASE